MRWNPFLNAAAASAYIGGIGLLFRYISSTRQNTPDTPLDPVVFLSLLVFSVAVMGFLFFYRPVELLLENNKGAAVSFFLKTIGTFGIITITLVVLVTTL